MPQITDETPRQPFTVAGKTLSCPTPYTEGHVLTANEAAALNQTFVENIRNNMAKKVGDCPDADEAQRLIDEYVAVYEFGVRRSGGPKGDPIEREAMAIAREKVREAIVAQGYKLKDFTAEKITELAQDTLAKYPQIRELAAENVQRRASIQVSV